MTADPGLVLEGLVAVLLLATIVYCAILYHRLAGLRGGQEEMQRLVAEFDKATARAQAGVAELKAANAAILDDLRAESRTARALADELSVLTESGARLADRIEGGLGAATGRTARGTPAPEPEPEPSRRDTADANVGGGSRSEAERELLAALRETR